MRESNAKAIDRAARAERVARGKRKLTPDKPATSAPKNDLEILSEIANTRWRPPKDDQQ